MIPKIYRDLSTLACLAAWRVLSCFLEVSLTSISSIAGNLFDDMDGRFAFIPRTSCHIVDGSQRKLQIHKQT